MLLFKETFYPSSRDCLTSCVKLPVDKFVCTFSCFFSLVVVLVVINRLNCSARQYAYPMQALFGGYVFLSFCENVAPFVQQIKCFYGPQNKKYMKKKKKNLLLAVCESFL